MNDSLQIGDVADLFNITTKTLRHYEKVGLLQPTRSENGYRVYGPADVVRIQRIRSLHTLGLSLRRIKDVLDSDNGELDWDVVLASLLDETEAELAALEARRERLEALLDSDGQIADPIVVARPPDDERINAYLAEYLPEPMMQQWRQDSGVYAMLGGWPVEQQALITTVGYAGPVMTGYATPITIAFEFDAPVVNSRLIQ